jgi:3-hydroxybutyryl-CoA dehydrogenase
MLNRGDTGFSSGKGWQEWTPEEAEASGTKLREYLIETLKRSV